MPKVEMTDTQPPSPSVGRFLLKKWATAPFEHFGKWSDAAKDFVRRWREEIKEEFAESLFVSAVVLPAVIGLARAGKTNEANRLIDCASSLALTESSQSLALSKTGAALIEEVRKDLRGYVQPLAELSQTG